MKTIVGIGMIILLITCCKKALPEIVKVESIQDIPFQNGYGWQKDEYFIVFNPPKDPFELAKLIADYNAATMNKEDILKYAGYYFRLFFKETPSSMEMYKTENPNYAYDLAQYEHKLFIAAWRYSEKYGIQVHYAGDYKSWKIYNAEGDEIFYPWLRGNPEGKETD